MTLDFPTILVLATFITGLIWAVDIAFLARRRHARVAALETSGQPVDEGTVREAGREPLLVEYSRSFFPIILLVLVVRSFVVEPFRIPSGSMMPTLDVGDFILVNKFAYGLRLPVINKEFLDLGSPKRGDVIVFRYPVDPSVDYIKRVVGVPGDHVVYKDKTLYINGDKASQTPVGIYQGGYGMAGADERREQLGDVTHDILIMPDRESITYTFTIPPGHYLAMGDNRDNSRDSRYWGLVPDQNLVGKAFLIWMNWDPDAKGFFIDWSRIGRTIK